MAAKKTVSTVEALSTRTLSWWAFKRLAPGTAFTLFCVYGRSRPCRRAARRWCRVSERMTAERAAKLLRAVAAERHRTGATGEQTAHYLAAAADHERLTAARPTRSKS